MYYAQLVLPEALRPWLQGPYVMNSNWVYDVKEHRPRKACTVNLFVLARQGDNIVKRNEPGVSSTVEGRYFSKKQK